MAEEEDTVTYGQLRRLVQLKLDYMKKLLDKIDAEKDSNPVDGSVVKELEAYQTQLRTGLENEFGVRTSSWACNP